MHFKKKKSKKRDKSMLSLMELDYNFPSKCTVYNHYKHLLKRHVTPPSGELCFAII